MQTGNLEIARAEIHKSVPIKNKAQLYILIRRITSADLGPIRPCFGKFKITFTNEALSPQGEFNHPGARFKTRSIAERLRIMGINSPVFVQECARRADGHINPTNIVIGEDTKGFEELANKFDPKKIYPTKGPDQHTALKYFILGDGQVPLAKDLLRGGPHFKIIYDKEATEIGHQGPYPITLEGYQTAFLDGYPSRVVLATYTLNEIDRQLAYIGNRGNQ